MKPTIPNPQATLSPMPTSEATIGEAAPAKLATPAPTITEAPKPPRGYHLLDGAIQAAVTGPKIGPEARQAITRKIRVLFPELMELRGARDAALAQRDHQVAELTAYLIEAKPFLTGDAQFADPNDCTKNAALDQSAHLMWDISQTEKQIESLRGQEESLRSWILAAVRAEYLALVRAALEEA